MDNMILGNGIYHFQAKMKLRDKATDWENVYPRSVFTTKDNVNDAYDIFWEAIQDNHINTRTVKEIRINKFDYVQGYYFTPNKKESKGENHETKIS